MSVVDGLRNDCGRIVDEVIVGDHVASSADLGIVATRYSVGRHAYRERYRWIGPSRTQRIAARTLPRYQATAPSRTGYRRCGEPGRQRIVDRHVAGAWQCADVGHRNRVDVAAG